MKIDLPFSSNFLKLSAVPPKPVTLMSAGSYVISFFETLPGLAAT
jgi:hypothetical protein